MKKEFLIIFLCIAVGLIFTIYYLLGPKNILKYSGLQIYEAAQKYEYLSMRGFDITTVIKGQDDKGDVEFEGEVTETLGGMLIVYTNGTCRTVEGLMGTKDVRAKEIHFLISQPISIEMLYPPTTDLENFLMLLILGDKIKGEFAFTTVKSLTPTIMLKIKNFNQKCFSKSYIEIETYSSGFIIKILQPIRTKDLSELIMWLDEEVSIKDFQSSQLSLFKGVENKSEIAEFEKVGVAIRIHEI